MTNPLAFLHLNDVIWQRMTEKSLLAMVVPDPVLSSFDLPLRAAFYPYGFPLELATNSSHVMQAAEEGWGVFRKQFDSAPARFHVGVVPGSNNPLPPLSTFRSREHLMIAVADSENLTACDFNQNFGFAWITETVAADHALVRYRFLTAGANTLIEQQHLAALHCGLVTRNGCGVALMGDSLAGKSTLAYACGRAGWTFVSDDGASLVRERSDCYAIGDPHVIRLREGAKALFPELEDHTPIVRPNGKMGIEIFTRELPIQIAPGCRVDHIVFLKRDEQGPARISRYPKDELLQWCSRYVTFGTAKVREAQTRCYLRLLSAGIWEMRYSDLGDAINLLERLVDSGG